MAGCATTRHTLQAVLLIRFTSKRQNPASVRGRMKLEQANTIAQTVVGEAAAPVGACDGRPRGRPSLRASGSNRCQIYPPQERVTRGLDPGPVIP